MLNLSRRTCVVFAGVLVMSGAIVVRSQTGTLAPAAKEWSTVSGDLGNTRYSALTQINKDTLTKLRGAWMSAKFDDGGGGRAMPVVKDGCCSSPAGSYVYAYDAKTGATVWKHQTGASPPSPGLTDFTQARARIAGSRRRRRRRRDGVCRA